MKLTEVNKIGYYCSPLDINRETIYEIIENTDKEWLEEEPDHQLLIDEWTLDSIDSNDRKVYEIYGGNLVAVQYGEPIEVVEITDTKYIMTDDEYGCRMREDKLSYKEKLEKVRGHVNLLKDTCNGDFDVFYCEDLEVNKLITRIKNFVKDFEGTEDE